MKIVSLKGIPRQSGSDFNTYTRQANVTYRTSRTGTVSEQSVSSVGNTISVTEDGTVNLNSISVAATMV